MVVLGGILASLKMSGTCTLGDHTFLFFGAGEVGNVCD